MNEFRKEMLHSKETLDYISWDIFLPKIDEIDEMQ